MPIVRKYPKLQSQTTLLVVKSWKTAKGRQKSKKNYQIYIYIDGFNCNL